MGWNRGPIIEPRAVMAQAGPESKLLVGGVESLDTQVHVSLCFPGCSLSDVGIEPTASVLQQHVIVVPNIFRRFLRSVGLLPFSLNLSTVRTAVRVSVVLNILLPTY